MASIRSLQQQLAESATSIERLRADLAGAQWRLDVAQREKEAIERELARTRARLDRAQNFVAAQTRYLGDVLETGKP